MSVCGNAFDLYTQFNQVIQVFFDLPVMLSIRKADKLSIAIFMVLVAEQAKLLEIGGVQAKVDMWPLQDLHSWSLSKEGIESPLKCINGKSAVAAQGFKSLTLQHPFSEPDKTILQALRRVVPGEQNTAVLASKPLFSGLLPPADNLQTAASPTPLFLVFAMHKKSLVKPFSLNFQQTLTVTALQPILPTIFQ